MSVRRRSRFFTVARRSRLGLGLATVGAAIELGLLSLHSAVAAQQGVIHVHVRQGSDGKFTEQAIGSKKDESPIAIEGLYNEKVFVNEYHVLDVETCTVVPGAEGVWAATTPPSHGTISSEIVDGPVAIVGNPGNCNGTIVPKNCVYDTLGRTSGQTLPNDSFCVAWSLTQGGYPEQTDNVTVTFFPLLQWALDVVPEVDDTGKTTTIAVGQTAGLDVEDGGFSVSHSWSALGGGKIF